MTVMCVEVFGSYQYPTILKKLHSCFELLSKNI